MASMLIEQMPVATIFGAGETDPVSTSHNGELSSMLNTFVAHLVADGGLLTRLDAQGTIETLANSGPFLRYTGLLDAVRDLAEMAAQANMRRLADGGPLIVWSGCDVGGAECKSMLIPLAVDGAEQIVLSVMYGHGSTVAAEEVERIATRLHPVAEGYFRLWAKRRAERRNVVDLEAALDLGGVAVAVLDRAGSVQYSNSAMRRLVSAGDGLRLHGRALVATDLPSAVRLQVAIQHAVAQALDGTADQFGQALTLVCKRPRALHGLPVAVSAVHRLPMQPNEPTVVVHAIEPDADLAHLVRPLCALHGLSPVETSMVLHLVGGHTLSDSAKLMRVKPQTARSYLKQVFAKTETNRQTDLVRLMLSSLLRLESPMVTVPN